MSGARSIKKSVHKERFFLRLFQVQLSIPSLDVVGSIDSGGLPCQDGVTSSNGHLLMVAGASGDRKTRISLLAKTEEDPGASLRARRGTRLTDCMDLLWLHKVNFTL